MSFIPLMFQLAFKPTAYDINIHQNAFHTVCEKIRCHNLTSCHFNCQIVGYKTGEAELQILLMNAHINE